MFVNLGTFGHVGLGKVAYLRKYNMKKILNLII